MILATLLFATLTLTAVKADASDDVLDMCLPPCEMIHNICTVISPWIITPALPMGCTAAETFCKKRCQDSCLCIAECEEECSNRTAECKKDQISCTIDAFLCRATKCGKCTLDAANLFPKFPQIGVPVPVVDLLDRYAQCKVGIPPGSPLDILKGFFNGLAPSLNGTLNPFSAFQNAFSSFTKNLIPGFGGFLAPAAPTTG